MSDVNSFTNLGICYLNRPAAQPNAPRTLILTGLARSGTSMLAQAVRAAGIFIGATANNVVHEDTEIAEALDAGDMATLNSLIAARDADHEVWGFKRPNLHALISPPDLRRFRNPHLVVIFRDIAAIAQRNVISEQLEPWPVLEEAAAAQQAQLDFLRGVNCPLMLMSYEKALAFPELFVQALCDFIRWPISAGQSQDMRGAVEPNRVTYTRSARRQYEGAIESLTDGVLSGWIRGSDPAEPVQLTLSLDDLAVLTFTADKPRADLAIGAQGFSVNVRQFLNRSHAIARVRVTGRTFELEKSGAPLGQLITS
jgi:hypothetical protein